MNATTIGSQVVGGLLASLLMRMSVWMCMYFGASFAAIATLTGFLFPENIAKYKTSSLEASTSQSEPPTARGQLKQVLDAAIWFTREDFVSISLLSTLLATTLGRSAPDIFLQYVTKRYGWSWSDVSEFHYPSRQQTQLSTVLNHVLIVYNAGFSVAINSLASYIWSSCDYPSICNAVSQASKGAAPTENRPNSCTLQCLCFVSWRLLHWSFQRNSAHDCWPWAIYTKLRVSHAGTKLAGVGD